MNATRSHPMLPTNVLGTTILFVYYGITIKVADWPRAELGKARKSVGLTKLINSS